MAAAVNMRNALQRCGFNLATSDFIMEQGYDSPEELLNVSEDDLDLMIKSASRHPPPDVTFPSLPIRKLYVLRFWADERIRTGLPTGPNLFTEQVMGEYSNLMRSDEVEVAARKGQDPTKPDAIKAEKDWFKFWEKFKNYLGRVRGAAKIPLSYIVREHDEVTDGMREEVYENHTKRLIATTILSGEHYRIDNESVWVELKGLVIDGFAWSYIKKFEKSQDGRSAVMALKRQCEGKTSVKTRKNAAYLSIRQSNYRGARKAFTFAQYVAIHQNAHNELEDCGEAMPESKKVSDFIDGITDQSLSAGITCVMSEERYSDSFEATQQFLGTLVANQAVHNRGKRGDDRNVSSAKGGKSGGGNKSKKGKSGKKLEARFYPRDEWEALTQEERAKVIELKKKKRESKSNGGGGKRKAASAETNRDDDAVTGEGDNAGSGTNDETSTARDNGGDEFGRGAHKKRKVAGA